MKETRIEYYCPCCDTTWRTGEARCPNCGNNDVIASEYTMCVCGTTVYLDNDKNICDGCGAIVTKETPVQTEAQKKQEFAQKYIKPMLIACNEGFTDAQYIQNSRGEFINIYRGLNHGWSFAVDADSLYAIIIDLGRALSDIEKRLPLQKEEN